MLDFTLDIGAGVFCSVTIIVPANAMISPTHAISGRISFRKNLAPIAVHIGTVAIINATSADVAREIASRNRS